MRKASLIPIITQSKRTKNLFGPCVNLLTYSHGTLGITSKLKFHQQMWILVHELRRWRTVLSRESLPGTLSSISTETIWLTEKMHRLLNFVASFYKSHCDINRTNRTLFCRKINYYFMNYLMNHSWVPPIFTIQVSLMTNFSVQDKETTNKRYPLRPRWILCVILDSGLFESMNTCIDNMRHMHYSSVLSQ